MTIICATHDYNMLAVCDRIVWIDHGQIDRIELAADCKIQKASLGEGHDE